MAPEASLSNHLTADQWIHIVVTYDAQSGGDRFILYTDGTSQHSVALSQALPTANTVRTKHYMGKTRGANNADDIWFDGDIASMQIWNRALSQ